MLSYRFEAICIFDILPPIRIKFDAYPNITEEVFFCYLFNRLSDEELHNLKKISLCQMCENDNEVFPFIKDCKGKIFLEDSEILHPVDQRVKEYLNSYISVMCY